MKKILFILSLIFLAACGNRVEVIDDFGDASFRLVNQDSVTVIFPDDYRGRYVVIGFIYTNCPDICSLIMQNLAQTQKEMNYPDDVHFIAATFDPERDTPSALKKYGETFRIEDNFDFLTGDSVMVFAMMDSARVRSQVSFSQTTEEEEELYFINHSDKIMVLDKQSRVILEYGGSQKVIPSIIKEDLNKIR